MEALLRELWQLRARQALAQRTESRGGPALVTGLGPVPRATTPAALRLPSGRRLLTLCAYAGAPRRQTPALGHGTGLQPVRGR